MIGLPTDVGGMAFAYRRDLFEDAGLPSDPAEVADLWDTWDEFLAVGESFAITAGALESGTTGTLRQFSPEWNEAIAQGEFAVIAAPSWMRSYLADIAPIRRDSGGWPPFQTSLATGVVHSSRFRPAQHTLVKHGS